MVVDAARCHRLEGVLDDAEGRGPGVAEVMSQEQIQQQGLGELRGGAESAVTRVEHRTETFGRLAAQLVSGLRRPGGGGRRFWWSQPARHGASEGLRLAYDVLTARGPGIDDGLEHLTERRHPMAGTVGEVRPGQEREPLRGGEHAHGPSATTGSGLYGLHVDGVDVRPLLPVDLHAHEMPVHHLGRRGV